MQGDRGKIKQKLNRLLGIFYPPVCLGCEELLDYWDESAFCEECKKKWEEHKEEFCRKCGQPIKECWCGVPDNIGEIVDAEVHLVQYDKTESIIKNLLFIIKRKNRDSYFNFLCYEMYNELLPRLKDDDYVVTSVPRNPKTVRYYGHDQALCLAKGFSALSGFEYIDCLFNAGGERQKTLTRKQREVNAAQSYKIKAGYTSILKGKRVILIDDVTTTGATVVRCAKLLKSKGAEKVYVMSIAKTV